MILGLGNDLCHIERIQKMLDCHGDRLLDHLFDQDERQAVLDKPESARAAAIAKRFAAKEACAKALGTGFADGVYWRDLRIEHAANGQPVMRLHNGALARLQSLTPPGMEFRLHVSLSDEFPLAMATVIISAIDSHGAKLA